MIDVVLHQDYQEQFVTHTACSIATISLSQTSRRQVYLDYAVARNSLTLVNYFVKPNEQKTSLLELCRGEK
jgi:hypothetical protein